VLSKLRADWRRGRATRYIKLDEGVNYSWSTKTAGEVVVRVRFEAHGETLVMIVREIGSADKMSAARVDVGIREIRGMLNWVAQMAADLGYTRLRVEGPRTTRPEGKQSFEFPLDRFIRSRQARR
jgi:hypothetical protein